MNTEKTLAASLALFSGLEKEMVEDIEPDEWFRRARWWNEGKAIVGIPMHVHQKFTCVFCGSRQTMQEAQKFWTAGFCEQCGKVGRIVRAGFTSCNLPVCENANGNLELVRVPEKVGS